MTFEKLPREWFICEARRGADGCAGVTFIGMGTRVTNPKSGVSLIFQEMNEDQCKEFREKGCSFDVVPFPDFESAYSHRGKLIWKKIEKEVDAKDIDRDTLGSILSDPEVEYQIYPQKPRKN